MWTYVAKVTGQDGVPVESGPFNTFHEAQTLAWKSTQSAISIVIIQFDANGAKVMDHWLKRPKMPKTPTGPKRPAPPKSTKLPRKLPEDPIARGVAIMREATEKPTKPKSRS